MLLGILGKSTCLLSASGLTLCKENTLPSATIVHSANINGRHDRALVVVRAVHVLCFAECLGARTWQSVSLLSGLHAALDTVCLLSARYNALSKRSVSSSELNQIY